MKDKPMYVISASRRTDIPAFHADWFINRIRSGMVGVVSPFGRGISEISLVPEDVSAIVFWTKNAAPILEHLSDYNRLSYGTERILYQGSQNVRTIRIDDTCKGLGETVRA